MLESGDADTCFTIMMIMPVSQEWCKSIDFVMISLCDQTLCADKFTTQLGKQISDVTDTSRCTKS
jgi:hypothetical protein